MAMQALTVRGIEALKPQANRYEVFDALTPGLAIRVTPSGHKSWVLLYRHHGRLRRLTLGRYPDRPLADARWKRSMRAGASSRAPTPPPRSRPEPRRTARRSSALRAVSQPREKLRSWSEVRRILEKEVLPTWRHRRVAGYPTT